jgi:hypothetical protein
MRHTIISKARQKKKSKEERDEERTKVKNVLQLKEIMMNKLCNLHNSPQ